MSAIKTGMLFNTSIVDTVASTLKEFYLGKSMPIPPLIIDPVCVSTSGHHLLEESALTNLVERLFPLATLITPNKAEAELLLKLTTPIGTIDEAISAARALGTILQNSSNDNRKLNVLLKGGHLAVKNSDLRTFFANTSDKKIRLESEPSDSKRAHILQQTSGDEVDHSDDDRQVIDVLFEADSDSCTLFSRPHIETSSTHGTGCTLSAAITCFISSGNTREHLTLPIS